jgi:hypothetical protein
VGSDVGSACNKELIVNAAVWRGERLLLTSIPKPSPYQMRMEIGCNSPNKQPDRPLKVPAVIGRDIREYMYPGESMLTL